MSWFLVRTHRYSLRLNWREGARLVYGGQQAQIELDAHHREISIIIWGPFPYNFLLILKQTLDDLLQTFQGIRVQHKIPCLCVAQSQLPHYHIYEDLEQQLVQGHQETICSQGMRVPLSILLYGIHSSTMPQMAAIVLRTQQIVTQHLTSAQHTQPPMLANEMQNEFTRLNQGLELLYRTNLHLERQKLRPSCPDLFLLERVSLSPLKPHDWVSRRYCLRLLCQYPQGPHPVKGEDGYEVR